MLFKKHKNSQIQEIPIENISAAEIKNSPLKVLRENYENSWKISEQ